MTDRELSLRHAAMVDAKLLLEWKNDPDVRRFSILSKEPIEWEAHLAWLEQRLKRPGLRIIEEGGRPVGDVRCDVDATGVIEVAIKVAPEARGTGVGTWALRQVCDWASREYPGHIVYARIVEGNVASLRLFRSCGFRVVKVDGNVLTVARR